MLHAKRAQKRIGLLLLNAILVNDWQATHASLAGCFASSKLFLAHSDVLIGHSLVFKELNEDVGSTVANAEVLKFEL